MSSMRSEDGPEPDRPRERAPGRARERQPGGLRERKKARTRAAIREHALALFREQGYHATTVEQIAAAAEVSPSTFFRYYPTKEDVVLQDDLDARMMEAFERQPAALGPVAAIRAATAEAFGSLTVSEWEQVRESTALTLTVPEIRARSFDEFASAIQKMTEAVAKRAGRPPDDLPVRALAGAVIGVVMAATAPWTDWTAATPVGEMQRRIDDALALLDAGLPLDAGSDGDTRQPER